MKLTILTLITILLLCLYSCGDRPYPRTMQIADSLVDHNPDSTLTLLQQLKDSITSEPEETRMYYHLLCVKTHDKAHLRHTSDSLILPALHYYRRKKDKRHLPEAYYYAGCVYTDLGNAPQALGYFLQAKEASKGSTDCHLLYKIYNRLGTLYLYQDIYEKASEAFRNALQYSIRTKDSTATTYSLRNLGWTFSYQGPTDSTIHYYQKTVEMAENIGKPDLKAMAISELAGYYTVLGKDREAYEITRTVLPQKDLLTTPDLYATMARYYYFANQTDSARHYYTLLSYENEYTYKEEAYQGLANIARRKGEYEKAWRHFDEFLLYQDSLQKRSQTEAVRKANSLYDYQLKKKESAQSRALAKRQKIWNAFLAITLAFAVVSFIAFREYYKRKEQAQRMQLEKLKKVQDNLHKTNLEQLEKNKNEIKILEHSLQEAQNTQDDLRQALLKAQKHFLEKKNEQIEAQRMVLWQSEIGLKGSDIYKKFHSSEAKMKDSDWQELTAAIDTTYNQFTQRLLELYPVKDIELQVCLLLKIKLSPAQISTIVSRSKQSVTSIRKRLYKKVFGEEGSPEQWDIFILNF